MWSMIAASVVDLPEPVGPVTSTSPCCEMGEALDRRRQVQLLERHDLLRDDAEHGAAPFSWRRKLARKRATPSRP